MYTNILQYIKSCSVFLCFLSQRIPMAVFRSTHYAIFLVFLHFLTVSFATRDDLEISTKLGKVRGKLLSVLDGEVRAFFGIPYAKPPLGKLRFKAPQPAERWDMKDATNLPNSCYQVPDDYFPGRTFAYTDVHNTYVQNNVKR